jgi:uncharacterized iron-regulated membrane protein
MLKFKRWIRLAHLTVGLASGLGVFLLALTGCLLAFELEIRDWIQPYRLSATHGAQLPPSALMEVARRAVPGKTVSAVGYEGAGRSATVEFYRNGEQRREYWIIAYVDPVSGRVLETVDRLNDFDFFQFVLDGHTRFWMPRDLGHEFVSYCTLAFTLMLISGIVLWWPRNRAALGQRLAVKWKSGWKRKRYDLHAVLGFYGSWILLFIVLTGLTWSFSWFSNSVYWVASGGKSALEWSEPASDTLPAQTLSSDATMDSTWKIFSGNTIYRSHILRVPKESASPVTVIANPDAGPYYRADYLYFDRHSLKELEVRHAWGKYENAGFADRLQRMYYDIHVGAIIGLPGKVLVFLAALIAASLPFTGLFMWLGKRRKSRPR